MTAAQVASHLRAKKTGRDKWIALCPAHPDRKPSLSIAAGKRWVLLKCRSHNCDTNDILRAAGLTMPQLAYDYETTLSPQLSREWAAKKLNEELYIREQRNQLLRLWDASLRSFRPVRTQSDFERDIERFCNSLEAR